MLRISFLGIFSVFTLVQLFANGLTVDKVKEVQDLRSSVIKRNRNCLRTSTSNGSFCENTDKPLNTFTEDDTQKACFTMKFNKPTEVSINGFDGKQFRYVLTPTGENTIKFKAEKQNGVKGLRSSAYVTLSDNRNYIVFINCWEDGSKSWSVASLKKQQIDRI